MATNKPAGKDSPTVFNLNAVKVEAGEFPPFRFVWGPKGRRWEMKHRELLDQIPLLEAAERGGEIGATIELLRSALGEEQWAEFRKLKIVDKQSSALVDAYNKHCGTDQGESDGSTDS